jgi:hypothetical protein
MDDHRKESRRRVLKGGTIEFDCRVFGCAVRNISETGAALEIPQQAIVPHEFKLVITTEQISRQCHVIWRKGNRIGVAFEEYTVKAD